MSTQLAPQVLINYGNLLRQKVSGDVLAKALQQAAANDNALANQLAAAGFTFDQANNLYYLGSPFEIRELISRFQYQDPPDTQYIGAATYRIPYLGEWMRLSNTSGGALTITSTPTVATPSPNIAGRGPVIELLNISANNIIVQDHGTLANSGLGLGANTRTLGTRDSIRLRYSQDLALWLEVYFSNVL